MITNSACTIFDKDGNKTAFPKVWLESVNGMTTSAKTNSRQPIDSIFIVIPTRDKLNIRLEDIIFGGIVENLSLGELKKKYKFYVVEEIKPFLFGNNPHYEIKGA